MHFYLTNVNLSCFKGIYPSVFYQYLLSYFPVKLKYFLQCSYMWHVSPQRLSESHGMKWKGIFACVTYHRNSCRSLCGGLCVCVRALPLVYTQSESPASTAHTLGSKTDAGFALGVKSYYPYQRGSSLKTRRHEAAPKCRRKQSLKRKSRVGWERWGNEGCWNVCMSLGGGIIIGDILWLFNDSCGEGVL